MRKKNPISSKSLVENNQSFLLKYILAAYCNTMECFGWPRFSKFDFTYRLNLKIMLVHMFSFMGAVKWYWMNRFLDMDS